MAGPAAIRRQGQPSTTAGIADHFHGVAAHGSYRRKTGEHSSFFSAFRRVKAAFHALDIGHGTTKAFHWHFQPEGIPRLQQLAFGHHQALPHSAVGRLPKISALCVLQVGTARNEGDLHVRQRRSDQHAKVLFFFQMGQHKALPVFVQHFFPTVGGKLHSAAARQRFQLDMHFCVVAQRLVMAYTLHRLRDGLFIKDAAGAELHVQTKPLCQQAAQHFQLDLAHELDMDLAQRFVPYHMELRFLFLQPMQLAQRRVHICVLRQQHLIAEHRFQHRQVAVAFCAKAFALTGFGQAGDSTHLPGVDGLCQCILCAGVQPQLVGLFGPRLAVRFARELCFHLQLPAGNAQPGQAGTLFILRDLEHLGPKGIQCRSRACKAVQPAEKLLHTVQLECRAEPARENMPPGNGRDDLGICQLSGLQHPVHQVLIAKSQRFIPVGLRHAKIHKPFAEAMIQLGQQLFLALAGQVGLVYKHKGGHMVAPQQPPERFGVALHAIGAADHQHGIIQNLQSALGLGGKIHMAGSVQQGDIRAACRQQCLLGKNSDPTGFFQRVCVQKGVLVIHAPQFADRAGTVEHGFRKGGLARVHMGQNAQNDMLVNSFHPLLLQFKIHVYCSTDGEKRKVLIENGLRCALAIFSGKFIFILSLLRPAGRSKCLFTNGAKTGRFSFYHRLFS